MNKKIKIGILVVLTILLVFFLIWFIRIKTAKIEVVLNPSLKLEFNDKKHVSDFITSINGKIMDDYIIDSKTLGTKEIKFKFINDDGIKVKYSYLLEVVDTTKPLIWLNDTYSVIKGSKTKLEDEILCGDNYDNNPKCTITGNYNLNKVGKYPLTFKAIDKSGNTSIKDFTLEVYEPKNNKNEEITYTPFEEFISKYKNDNTEIGLDISYWQGDIDFKKLKESKVEFLFIRVGGTDDNKTCFLDSKFEQNIKGANENGIKTGIYFYSYANSKSQAKKEAEWVIEKIKPYKVDLPIVFDWEEWGDFNSYNLSFYTLNELAKTYLDVVKSHGYQGMLYSSKNYLENIWYEYDTWLAHYTDKTDYKGKYKYWQVSNTGKVDGINGAVDVNIYYKK